MEVKIRKATERDRSGVAFVFADAFSNDWNILSHDTVKVARALEQGFHLDQYLVAEANHKIVGFLALVPGKQRAFTIPLKDFQKEFGFFKGYMVGMMLKSDMEREIPLKKNQAYIDIIGVSKAYQHRGVASSLIDYVISNDNYLSFSLSVTNINETAQACYQKKGFQEYKREKVKFAKQKGFSEYLYLKYEKAAQEIHSRF